MVEVLCIAPYRFKRRTTGRRRNAPPRSSSAPSQTPLSSSWPTGSRCLSRYIPLSIDVSICLYLRINLQYLSVCDLQCMCVTYVPALECVYYSLWIYIVCLGPVTDPWHPEELDQAVVCAEAGGAADLQDSQEWPVGGHGAAQRLRAHRAALQEGRLLLQALPPPRAVHLGRQGADVRHPFSTP